LKESHPEISLDKYKQDFPDHPILSELAKELVKKRAEKKASEGLEATDEPSEPSLIRPMHEVFNLGKRAAGVKDASGVDVMITTLSQDGAFSDLIPDIDDKYIFQIPLLKNILMGFELNMPVYLWGHSGVGKSTVLEQVCAHTFRPYLRMQHTANIEEAHIVGQILANELGTYFEPGPLAIAMKNGFVFNADEYDFASPAVLAVYQAVLEGKPLYIKEAPAEWRVVKPHANFRFVATGNTNGAGDDTGLYAGTSIGNSANYSRFAITDHVEYMPKKQEIDVVASQGKITQADAKLIVEFAEMVRKSYNNNEMSTTIGPRELINIAKIGIAKLSWIEGVKLAYINRLNVVDREVADGIVKRIFVEAPKAKLAAGRSSTDDTDLLKGMFDDVELAA
jgi:cobaltochelatase CobS